MLAQSEGIPLSREAKHVCASIYFDKHNPNTATEALPKHYKAQLLTFESNRLVSHSRSLGAKSSCTPSGDK
jgi:hypothetical protein